MDLAKGVVSCRRREPEERNQSIYLDWHLGTADRVNIAASAGYNLRFSAETSVNGLGFPANTSSNGVGFSANTSSNGLGFPDSARKGVARPQLTRFIPA
jgi:hypothetical protein